MKTEFLLQYNAVCQSIDVHIRHCGGWAEQVIVRQSTDDADYHAPVLSLNLTEAQNLMDQLWFCGLRPSEGTGSAGALAATQAHLEDVRVILNRMMNHILPEPQPELRVFPGGDAA